MARDIIHEQEFPVAGIAVKEVLQALCAEPGFALEWEALSIPRRDEKIEELTRIIAAQFYWTRMVSEQ